MLDFCSACKKDTSWEEEDKGAEAFLVCRECGNCKESVPFETSEEEDCAYSSGPSGSQLVHYDHIQTNAHGKFYKKSTSIRNRELRFIDFIKKIASKVNLPRQSTDRCVSCGKLLLERGYNFRRRTIIIAAALVFLDQQNSKRSLFMRDFAKKIDMKFSKLGNEVKNLRKECGEMFVKTEVEPKECIQSVVDELSEKFNLSMQQKIDVQKMAAELREVTGDCLFRGKRMSDVHKGSYFAYFSLALNCIDPSHREVPQRVADFTGYNIFALKQKIYMVRSKLLALAKTLPSAERHYVTLRDIHNFIPTIVRNKIFLTKGTDKFYVNGGSKEKGKPCTAPLPESSSSCMTSEAWEESMEEDEEEGTLSDLDLDVDQYIASEREVEQKRANILQMELNQSKTTKPASETRKRRGKKSS